MEVDDRECHCVGSVNKTLARTLRDEFCRNVSLPGNGLVVGTSTPPNGRRCGTYKPENPTADDLCFCDSPLKQSSTNFNNEFLFQLPIFTFLLSIAGNIQWYSLQLKTKPWQWTEDLVTGKSPLDDPSSAEYKATALALEKAVSKDSRHACHLP